MIGSNSFWGSFRFRMVLYSTLIAGIGVVGFALLSLGFYQHELRRNLEMQLEELLSQTAPALLRVSSDHLSPLENRFAGRLLGRLEEFGAVYAVSGKDGKWQWGNDWPMTDAGRLAALAEKLPPTNLRAISLGKRPEEMLRDRRRNERKGEGKAPSMREGLRILNTQDSPAGWIIAGVSGVDGCVLVGVPGTVDQPQMQRLMLVLSVAAPFALGLVALGAWLLSARVVQPIRKLASVASATTAEDLSLRISGEGLEREFRELIDVFNGMMDRLEKSFGQARRFGQDAAHELNTPLTILTGKIDEAVAGAVDGSEEQLRLVEIAEELGRLREIVRKLHLLARIDGGGLRPERLPADLSALVQEVVEEMKEAFPGIDFGMEGEEVREFPCDRSLVRQVLLNLLSNAGKYNRQEGTVLVELHRRGDDLCIEVLNTGTAIPLDFQSMIFDRFSRGDLSRTSRGGSVGLGLGLSISREFARAQGGDLLLESGEEDRIRFVFSLPWQGK